MNPRASFRCPSATDEEVAFVEDPTSGKKKIAVTYGFYYPYGGVKMFNIENQDNTILISETSNSGSNDTYNPHPLTDPAGKPIADAYVIGWSDSNLFPSKNSQYVTRLAFTGSKAGSFLTVTARHDEGNNALVAAGGKIDIKANSARINIVAGLPGGIWAVPPGSAR
jgi:hypothetical protein